MAEIAGVEIRNIYPSSPRVNQDVVVDVVIYYSDYPKAGSIVECVLAVNDKSNIVTRERIKASGYWFDIVSFTIRFANPGKYTLYAGAMFVAEPM